MIKKIFFGVGVLLILAAAGLWVYGYMGTRDARKLAPNLAARADLLAEEGRGVDSLTPQQMNILLRVEDPAFYMHDGVDLQTPGAGITTITQGLAKRVGFEQFKPGVAKYRQTTFAQELEQHLTKDQILTLFLDTVEMGRGPNGWATGLHEASQAFYDKPLAEISHSQFIRLVAVMIAPGALTAYEPNARLLEREERIYRLLANQCEPEGNRDVWLEGCAESGIDGSLDADPAS